MTSDDNGNFDPELKAQQEKNALVDGDKREVLDDSVAALQPPPVIIVNPANLSIVERAFSVHFIIPWDGVHQVWVYRVSPGLPLPTPIISEEWFSGRVVNEVRMPVLSDGPFSIMIRWRLGNQYSDFKNLECYVSNPVSFDDVVGDFHLRGYGGYGTTCHPVHVSGGQRKKIGLEVQGSDAWLSLLDANYPPGRIEVGIYQVASYEGRVYQRLSATKMLLFLSVPIISGPFNGQVVRAVDLKNLKFRGRGHVGLALKVVRADDHYVTLSEARTTTSRLWELSPLVEKLVAGEMTVEVQYQHVGISHGYSKSVSFTLDTRPVILKPESSSPQEQPFLLEGNNGLSGARIEIYLDQTVTLVGTGLVGPEGDNWSVSIDGLTPGPVSLVAEQYTSSNSPSGRGPARLFKIRPPQLENIAINFGLDGQITFKGTGSPGATVEIFRVSGPDAPPIAPVSVVDGKWEATAADWPLGTYGIQHLQRVPDGANGWIVSLPSSTIGFTKLLPDVDKVDFTPVYQPTFSGLGYPGATVKLIDPESLEPVAPDAPVSQQNREWSSMALTQWGPGNRSVHVKQYLDGNESPKWVALDVKIPPLEPTVEEPSDDGLSPTFTGTCWPAARVDVSFSDDHYGEIWTASVIGERWTFSRQAPFEAGVIHTIRAIQTFAGQSSEPASRTFSVYRELLQPVIESPLPDEETDSALTVTGDNGMSGASMQLWDARDKKPLGNPVILAKDGPWSIALSGLAIDRWFISAQQTLNNRLSEHSDVREFNVVVMPPEFCNPLPDSDLPRTSTLSGKGRPGALVTVWCEGLAEPLLCDVLIGPDGFWDGSVTLAVGDKVFWATQTFEGKTSKPSPEVSCRFVPHAVLPESPTPQEQLGNTVTVSGFAVPGDQITLMRGPDAIGQASVLPDGTWSITATLAPPDGAVTLSTVASCDEFASAPSEWVSQVGLYLPAFTNPEAGHWVSPLVMCTGSGKPGEGKLMSWYSPDVVLAAPVTVTPAGWTARPTAPFANGAQWCRFEQTFSTGTPISDCSESGRFDVRVESSGDS